MSHKLARASAGPRLGALPLPGGGARFRVWAPKRRRVEVVLGPGAGEAHPLEPEGDGYFAGAVGAAGPGSLYRYRLDGEGPYPDPASRFQPEGPHGPSEIVDPGAYQWRQPDWRGARLRGQVLYELHVGTFTREGTWDAAACELARLAELGVTALEIMPVADFPGRFGWGYDGACWYAPTRLYGRPERFKAFVDAAHGLGLAVLLDVVYNHFGPDGNYLRQFSDDYFCRVRETDWGEAINYDGPGSAEVRRFAAGNAAYWISEFRLDGLRLDATQNIYDRSRDDVLAEIAREARRAAGGRDVVIVAENEPQDMRLVRPAESGGCGFDGLWNDDFHHSAFVALTGLREAYYLDYEGSCQELVSSLKRGTLYQGQRYAWQRKRRGTATRGVSAPRFVHYLENHDQVANSSYGGLRLAKSCDPARLRALTALLLLGPQTPLLFQGQEDGGRAPFVFFADHKPGLREAVFRGRRRFMRQFPSIADADARGLVPDPAQEATFQLCKNLERPAEEAAPWRALHRDLLRLRREDPVFCAQERSRLDGAVLGPQLLALRFFSPDDDDRLLLANLGPLAELRVAPEPLLAEPAGRRWSLLWSSEAPEYGGRGTAPSEPRVVWRVAPRCVLVFAARSQEASHGD